MASFEAPSEKGVESEGPNPELLEYFESYVADAEAAELVEREGYIDLERIKQILEDLKAGNYSSASEYLDSEIKRMESIHEEMRKERMSLYDIEEGMPYLQKVTRLRDSLLIQE